MTSLIQRITTLQFSSDPRNGATDIRDNKSSFTAFLSNPITVPRSATNCTLSVIKSNIPWTSPNISEFIGNNHLHVTYNTNDYDFVIPDGLYSLDDLSFAINRAFTSDAIPIPNNTLRLYGDNATQKVVLGFDDTLSIDFTQSNTFRVILGFDSQIINGVVDDFITADDVANFNTITSFNISAPSLVSRGIETNGSLNKAVIGNIPIVVSPGFINTYIPLQLEICPTSSLVGQQITTCNFSLLDQNLDNVEMLESFEFTINLSYYEQI